MQTRHLVSGLILSVTTIVSFAAQEVPAFAQIPGYSAIGDYNGDGLADIADHWGASGSFWIRRNLGNGTFEAPGTVWGSGTTSAPLGDWRILTADFTGDGFTDYADYHVVSGQIWIHRNLQNGTFDTGTWGYGTVPAGTQVIAGDLNADGRADLLDGVTGPNYYWYQNVGAGGSSFAASQTILFHPQTFGPPYSGKRLILADLNADNCDDLILFDLPSHTFYMAHNVCGGTVAFPSVNYSWAAFSHPWFTTVFGDFTGDGYADYADVNLSSGEIWVHRNLGSFLGNTFDSGVWAYGLYSDATGFSIFGQPAFFF